MSLRDALDKIRSSSDPRIEEAVKFRMVAPILEGLGWDPAGPEVRYEYPVGSGRVDFALGEPGKIATFIEAKASRVDLALHVDQVVRYAFHEGVAICVLTNGLEWWLYLPMERVQFEQRRFAVLRIKEDPVEELHDDLNRFLNRENLLNGEAHEAARRQFILDKAIPRVWRDMLSGPDDALVELVRNRVHEQEDLLPTVEEVDRQHIFVPPAAPTGPVTPRRRPDRPRPPGGPNPARRPVGFQLWGESYPVRSGNEILLGVAECLYRTHRDSFEGRILTLSWASRDGKDRWKEIGTTGIYLHVNFKVVELMKRSKNLLELFGHPPSELEVVYD